MTKRFQMPFAPLVLGATLIAALAGCSIIPGAEPPASAPLPPAPLSSESLTYARLGQTVSVGGPLVTPQRVLEDSRCPMNARCVWAGQVRLALRVDLGPGAGEMEITSGKPLPVADGTLELVEIAPDRVAGGDHGGEIRPGDYRFGFRFSGGL